jgi:cell division septum initiation protein DivIVA
MMDHEFHCQRCVFLSDKILQLLQENKKLQQELNHATQVTKSLVNNILNNKLSNKTSAAEDESQQVDN